MLAIFDGSVHAFDLPVGPGVIGLREPVLDSMLMAEPVEGWARKRCRSLAVLRQVFELDAVVGKHRVDAVLDGFNESFEQRGGRSHVGLFDQFDDYELRSSIDGHE